MSRIINSVKWTVKILLSALFSVAIGSMAVYFNWGHSFTIQVAITFTAFFTATILVWIVSRPR